ncbi:hypothetical protein MLD38_022237 [Melastoma candidum]|uniref:Uncharacterized protein n=1 Tax=Melastoma candidum TaxID=119954 RepID=A0ACB9QM04_9MYRT|nr:hypothetical protein MLD38_022237 [Melastoma candidum]
MIDDSRNIYLSFPSLQAFKSLGFLPFPVPNEEQKDESSASAQLDADTAGIIPSTSNHSRRFTNRNKRIKISEAHTSAPTQFYRVSGGKESLAGQSGHNSPDTKTSHSPTTLFPQFLSPLLVFFFPLIIYRTFFSSSVGKRLYADSTSTAPIPASSPPSCRPATPVRRSSFARSHVRKLSSL